MIGILFFGTLALFFWGLSKFSRWLFKFLNRKIGFDNLPIWKKYVIYGLYFFSIFMVLFGDEWLGRIQHKHMCEKYAYIKYDEEALFNPNLEKNSLERSYSENQQKYVFFPMKISKIYYKNKDTRKIYFESSTVRRSGGWIARLTRINFVSFIKNNEIFFDRIGGSCIDIDFTGKEEWHLPNRISNRIRELS